MKTLLLLRHAKSSWDDSSQRDFDRPLSERGQRDAPRMGKQLSLSGPIPDLILCSPAVRAQQTLTAFIQAAHCKVNIKFDERIYGAQSAQLIKIVRELPDTCATVLMVGHNPGFEELAARLTAIPEHMPTAALVCIELPFTNWDEVEDGQGRRVWFLTPKQLR
ncbi:MAG: histidine phosphatase family protein [Acidobacteriota bacterium]